MWSVGGIDERIWFPKSPRIAQANGMWQLLKGKKSEKGKVHISTRDGHGPINKPGRSSKMASSWIRVRLGLSKPENLNFPETTNFSAMQQIS